jgi:PAS domain S-box-containing protein
MIRDFPDVDLSACAREPIQIPGAIQPHGALLVASLDGSTVTHASANLGKVLGIVPSKALGRRLDRVLGAQAAGELVGAALHDGNRLGRMHSIESGGGKSLHLRAHRSGERICIDIEPTLSDPRERPPFTLAQAVLESFQTAHNRVELCELAVRGLRSILGYDRVMAYRFGAEGHGEVIAEALASDLDPYLGQRYPASDIPQQARDLYLRQRVGVIGDSSYDPVPLLADPALADASPVDLTHSVLRSVSPVHREFMRNMKTAASLTIGLASRDEHGGLYLWGMLVCHHSTPRVPGPEFRAFADTIGQVVSLLLEGHGAAEVAAERADRNETLHLLVSQLGNGATLLETFSRLRVELLHLVDAGGALVRFRGETLAIGRVPDQAVVERALELLDVGPVRATVAVDDLGLRHPELAAAAPIASGALLLPLDESGGDAILWFRPEKTRTVVWGGNPDKPAIPNPVTGMISPRASFEAWKEVVHGHSDAWTPADLALAAELGRSIEVEVGRRTKQARDLFDRIFESSPTALLLVGPHGIIKMLNVKAEAVFGYGRDELVGQPLEILMPKRFRAGHVGLRVEFQAHATSRPMGSGRDLVGLRKDGSEFPVEITLSPIDTHDLGGIPMVQASITDITARLADERAKRLMQEQLQSIAKNVPAMIGYWNRDLICEFANELYRTVFGIAPERIIGTSLRDLLGEEGYANNEAHVTRVLAGEEQRFERTLITADGGEFIADAHYVPDFDDRDEVRGFYVLATDVSRLRRAQLELEDLNAKLRFTNNELDQFVYTASHDLRSPLRGITSLTQFVLEDDHSLNPQTQERIMAIAGRARRMQNLLNDVLAYARAGKGAGPIGAPMTAADLVDEIAATLSVPADFTISKDPSLASVMVHSVPLTQVLQNLISNAINHHDKPAGTIRLAAVDQGTHWRFSVTDDGPGIAEAYRESIFKMFTTLKRRDEVEASGIGLALVRKLVTLHGGSCGVESAPVRGASFWFEWPKI